MAEVRTQPNAASVAAFLDEVAPPARREDARTLDRLFRKITGEAPRMWGPSMIGYGEYRTTYASGREVHWMRAGFSPRRSRHSLYLMGGYCDGPAGADRDAMLKRLGRHSTGKSCLYIGRLADVDLAVLEEIIAADWQTMQRLFPHD